MLSGLKWEIAEFRVMLVQRFCRLKHKNRGIFRAAFYGMGQQHCLCVLLQLCRIHPSIKNTQDCILQPHWRGGVKWPWAYCCLFTDALPIYIFEFNRNEHFHMPCTVWWAQILLLSRTQLSAEKAPELDKSTQLCWVWAGKRVGKNRAWNTVIWGLSQGHCQECCHTLFLAFRKK